MSNIYSKLMRIQQNLKVQKNQKNNFSGYNFRSAEQILEAVKPLIKVENCVLFSSDEIKNIGDSNYIFTTLKLVDCETGDTIEVTSNAREDKMAKGLCSSQMTGVSSSYSKKYALQNMFAIDNSKDADNGEMLMNIFKAHVDMCGTVDELEGVWNNMEDPQKKQLSKYVMDKKKELLKNK